MDKKLLAASQAAENWPYIVDSAIQLAAGDSVEHVATIVGNLGDGLRQHSGVIIENKDRLAAILGPFRTSSKTHPSATAASLGYAQDFYFYVWRAVDLLGQANAVLDKSIRFDTTKISENWDKAKPAIASFCVEDSSEIHTFVVRERSLLAEAKAAQAEGDGKPGRDSASGGMLSHSALTETKAFSKADTPQRWAKRFGISARTFKRRVKDGTIPAEKLSDRSYRVREDALPAGQ